MKCDGCTLCCRLLETHDIISERGVYCKQCEPDVGCKIYNERPSECQEYQCTWTQMEYAGAEMRPDKSHIIFDRISDRTICAAQDPDYELNDLVKEQIKFFLKEGFSVVVIKNETKHVYVTKGHSFEEAKRDIHDSAELYRRFN